MSWRTVGGTYTSRRFNVVVSRITHDAPSDSQKDIHFAIPRANAQIPTDKKTVTHTVPWTRGVGKDDRDDDEQVRRRSIRVLPTPTQKVTIGQWLDGYRFVYNQCVALSRMQAAPHQDAWVDGIVSCSPPREGTKLLRVGIARRPLTH